MVGVNWKWMLEENKVPFFLNQAKSQMGQPFPVAREGIPA